MLARKYFSHCCCCQQLLVNASYLTAQISWKVQACNINLRLTFYKVPLNSTLQLNVASSVISPPCFKHYFQKWLDTKPWGACQHGFGNGCTCRSCIWWTLTSLWWMIHQPAVFSVYPQIPETEMPMLMCIENSDVVGIPLSPQVSSQACRSKDWKSGQQVDSNAPMLFPMEDYIWL